MIAIGCDHGGFELKELICQRLTDEGCEVEDFGSYTLEPVEYPDVALRLAKAITNSGYEFGVLVCGTGIGMSIAANKVRGIRAALCADCFSARMAKEHNNANIIALGARTLGRELAWEIINAFRRAKFQEGIHAPRVQTLTKL